MSTRVEFRDDNFEGGEVVIEDIRDAHNLSGILEINGYAVNLTVVPASTTGSDL